MLRTGECDQQGLRVGSKSLLPGLGLGGVLCRACPTAAPDAARAQAWGRGRPGERLSTRPRDHAKKLHRRAKATFLCQPSTACLKDCGCGALVFRRHSPARWPASGQPAERGRGWEGRRGGAHRRSRQQVPPGEHLRFGRWFERGRRHPRAKLGVQWVTPDGVKSKTDKALGVRVICFCLFPSQILYFEGGYFYSNRRFQRLTWRGEKVSRVGITKGKKDVSTVVQ